MSNTAQRPSINRAVHFHTEPGSKPEAATIIDVADDESTVTLYVINHNGTPRTEREVKLVEEGGTGKHWAWPPRV